MRKIALWDNSKNCNISNDPTLRAAESYIIFEVWSTKSVLYEMMKTYLWRNAIVFLVLVGWA